MDYTYFESNSHLIVDYGGNRLLDQSTDTFVHERPQLVDNFIKPIHLVRFGKAQPRGKVTDKVLKTLDTDRDTKLQIEILVSGLNTSCTWDYLPFCHALTMRQDSILLWTLR
jgi:hypothetical protein